MKYIVDAKFEKGQPRLRVLDAETGTVKMEWSLSRVTQMFDDGEINPEDFLHPERYGMQLLVKNLFLLSCIESISSEHAQINYLQRAKSSEWQFKIKARPV